MFDCHKEMPHLDICDHDIGEAFCVCVFSTSQALSPTVSQGSVRPQIMPTPHQVEQV